jgi:molybdopterin/thiamine biosynthesis adenylyltransferase/rhodanese-related sulfurtransferase
MSKISAKDLYQRQTTLKEIGEIGQQKLGNTNITIVGCGGLGSVAAVYLAGSGVGNIHLVDYDTVDVSNLHRQVFFTIHDIGKSKVAVLSKYIQSISPLVNVTFSNESITKSNVFDVISNTHIVLDCTDHLPTKYLLNDACVIKDKVLVYGSLYKYDGYVATFNFLTKENQRTSNLRDAFPEIPTDNIPNCSEIGTLNSIVGIIGIMQANEVLKIVAGIGKPLINELLIYNSLENSQFKMKLKSAECHSERMRRISTIFESETYEDISCEIEESIVITQEDFKKVLENKIDSIKIISVIEDEALELPFEVDEKVPFYDLDEWLEELNSNKNEYIFVCSRGNSSLRATYLCKEQYPKLKGRSLKGGIEGF